MPSLIETIRKNGELNKTVDKSALKCSVARHCWRIYWYLLFMNSAKSISCLCEKWKYIIFLCKPQFKGK